MRREIDAAARAVVGAEQHAMRVLIVEDDPGDRELILAQLRADQDAPLALEWVPTFAEAESRLETERFDVLLLDLMLPDAQGHSALVRLRAVFPDLPIVVHTGIERVMTSVVAVEEGADEVVVKGESDGGALARALHLAVARRRLQTQRRYGPYLA